MENEEILKVLKKEAGTTRQPQLALAKTRFLQGKMSAQAFESFNRRLAAGMGLRFALFFGLLQYGLGWLISGKVPTFRSLATQLPGYAAAGLIFGFAMYFAVVRPGMKRIISLKQDIGADVDVIPNAKLGQCPTCGAEHSRKVMTATDPMVLHYILNPGVAFAELLFGIRIPAEASRCLACGTVFHSCHSCSRSFDSLDLAGRRFHRGIRCPHCSGVIPARLNLLTRAILKVAGWVRGKGDSQ
ncbi:hypothetical protein [Oligoflexus tunisiensis]|uniref:hypothetical protein n=1 Tax=Oligoflexus tunisiensis TaxID=708132 RepID=UPI00114CD925|nr:hypothetical protein [Oligoflexus tunisiensis]